MLNSHDDCGRWNWATKVDINKVLDMPGILIKLKM